jgi:hypothetical protein
MLFAAIIAVSLGSYIKLALNSMTLADRSYYLNAAINLAEVGIESAVYCYNQLDDVAPTAAESAWLPYGWTLDTTTGTATRTLTGFTPGAGVTGTVKVHCTHYNPASTHEPVVTALATVTPPRGPALTKYLEVSLRRRALFPRGMVVRETITAVGGSLSLDSWDSDHDGDPSTAPVPYSTTYRRTNATLATLSSDPSAISIGNGKVYGYISTAEGGTVAYGSTAVLSGDFAGTTVETDRISHDFDVTTFPPVTPPTNVASWITMPTLKNETVTLPRAGDTPDAADGFYYYNFGPGENIQNSTITLADKVVLILNNHAGVTAITLSGSSGITLGTAGAMRIYSNGDINMGGSGFTNNNAEAATAVIYGTSTTPGGQDITLKGNGLTSISLYAPNADISLSGGGSVGEFSGALVGNSVKMNGNTQFHYDEALARVILTGNPYGIKKWRELRTEGERGIVATKLGF